MMNGQTKPISFSRAALDESRRSAVGSFNELYQRLWYATTPDDEIWTAAGVDAPPIDDSSPRPRSHPLHVWALPTVSNEWAEPMRVTLKTLAKLAGTQPENYATVGAEISFTGMQWPGRTLLNCCHQELRRHLTNVAKSHRYESTSTELDRMFVAAAKDVLKTIETLQNHLVFSIPADIASAMASDILAQAEVPSGGDAVSSSDPAASNGDGGSVAETRKRRGRPKADVKSVEREARIVAAWERARDSGVYKVAFAREQGLTRAKFDAMLDRVKKRNERSDK